MDTAISNGDFLLDARGKPVHISGIEEILQRVLIRLSVKKGSFVYDKNLGSKLYTLNFRESNLEDIAMSLVEEALTDMSEVIVKKVSLEPISDSENIKMDVLLKINDTEEGVVITL